MALATTACSSDSDATPAATLPSTAPTTATTAPATTSTTEALSPEDEAAQAYLDITREQFRVLSDPNPNDPAIAQGHSGSNLQTVTADIGQLAEARQAVRFGPNGPPTPSVRAVTIASDSQASLEICLVDDSQVIDVSTNEVVNDVVSSRLGEASMVKEEGRWKLDSLKLIERWADGNGCDR